MSTLLHMARWAHSVSIADVPPALRERLRLQAASTLAAAAAGVHSEDAQIALTVARRMGAGSHRIAPGVDGLTMEGALFAGASLSMAHDYDDWMLCAHPSHSAVWAAWVGAAELGLGWDAALRAQIVANEILARLGGYCLPGRQNGQSWSFLHGVGGALVGGLLRGHSPEQLASGMALTLAQASHVDWRLFSGPGKTLMAARPLLDGWRVAELVEEGVTGPVGLLDEDSEFTSVFAGGRPVRGWFSGLPVEDPSGTAWLTWSLTVKCVPGCDYLTAAVEAT
ncbi:MAG: MmgE/PrpD family protein [Deltaproteobacteria bacterium]|nr:MmgE/PrpD family protein [Deltaproteobacteria bacterium]